MNAPARLHPRLREMVKIAESLGVTFEGFTSGGHARFRAPDGAVLHTSATPSDHRTVLNFRAQCERATGRKSRRGNAAHYRHRSTTVHDFRERSHGEKVAADRREHIEREAARIRDEVAELVADGSRTAAAAARDLIGEYARLTEQAAELHMPLSALY